MKKGIIFVCIVVLVFSLSACDPSFKYQGEHRELENVAVQSIPGCYGHIEDQIYIMEEDEYGRVLFAYEGISDFTTTWPENRMLAICIMQKQDNNSTWVILNSNVLLRELPEEAVLDETLVSAYFSEQDILELKERNDWDRPLQQDVLFELPYYSAFSVINYSDKELKYLKQFFSSDIFVRPLCKNEQGEVLCFLRKVRKDGDTYVPEQAYLFMMNRNEPLDQQEIQFIQLDGIENYQEQAEEFLKSIGWRS